MKIWVQCAYGRKKRMEKNDGNIQGKTWNVFGKSMDSMGKTSLNIVHGAMLKMGDVEWFEGFSREPEAWLRKNMSPGWLKNPNISKSEGLMEVDYSNPILRPYDAWFGCGNPNIQHGLSDTSHNHPYGVWIHWMIPRLFQEGNHYKLQWQTHMITSKEDTIALRSDILL